MVSNKLNNKYECINNCEASFNVLGMIGSLDSGIGSLDSLMETNIEEK